MLQHIENTTAATNLDDSGYGSPTANDTTRSPATDSPTSPDISKQSSSALNKMSDTSLISALKEDLDKTIKKPETLITTCRENHHLPIDERKSALHFRFQSLSPKFMSEIKELEHFFLYQWYKLEAARNKLIVYKNVNEDMPTAEYAEMQHHLINRIDDSLGLLEKTQQRTTKSASADSSPQYGIKHRAVFPKTSKKILEEWFEDHIDNPYLDPKVCAVLSRKAKMSVQQVRKWFTNRRGRMSTSHVKRHNQYK
jgi:hypothetical protein